MDSMCRLCLVTANGENIFENGFDKVIKASFGIKLKRITNWPSHACETCINYLNGLKDFKAKIETSQNHLKKLESQVVVETETITEIYEDLPETWEILDHSPLQGSSRSNTKPKESPPFKRTKRVYKDDQSPISTIVPDKPNETPPAKKAKRVNEKKRTPGAIIPEKSPTTATENRKPKSPSPIPFDEGSRQSNYDTGDNSQLVESRKSTDQSKRLKEHLVPLKAQLKKMNLLGCNKCEFQGNALQELRRHYKDQHHKLYAFICCNHKWGWGDIYDHMEYHLDENRFKCDICDKKMMAKRKLKTHRNNSHARVEDCKFKCETCGKPFNVHSYYKTHLKTHQNHFEICEICGKEVANVPTLKTHINVAHTDRITEECDICGKQFLNVKEHKYNLHNNKFNGTIKCEYCGKEVLKRWYTNHVKRVHTTNEEVYKCNVCGKELKNSISYKRHMDIHTGVLFDCHFCEHQTNCKSNLHKHMKAKHVEEYAEFKKRELTKVRIRLASSGAPNSS